ncbi:hypothetical protein Mp_1g12150 [Marchantia polymorpha subsp. ruderalis]|uniref:MULE transposase domain-containing protein n=2 Tax=Marchantia polymorpha TaxID=3197 RepID=A0AAF6APA3_MARPO|nr:hypothetical protein MARPO_0014s0010 [Marchantia polymorpha]PTQ45451.1 hypothetical protein MARPO_0014s0016 [Marchantia polymorpha]BBM98273.1 hypothetical protein Mp_1g12150 [Marchantia polymorpha subsp. ruderalis]|eukprot:PTQ45445.1 hypothetical protein MARPO_0014s0010 [Marchantia polymorpha]
MEDAHLTDHRLTLDPDITFPEREDLVTHVQNHGLTSGYAYFIQRSDIKRNTGIWQMKLSCSQHNHDPSTTIARHPSSRRLTKEVQHTVNKSLAAGVPARPILTSLRQHDSNSLAVASTIYNAKAKRRHEKLAGHTPIQALLDELRQGQFKHVVQFSNSGNVERLSFAHPNSIFLARRFNSVILLDCTYKTNKFGMPLLHVIGRTALNTSFTIAIIFLNGEEIGDYVWALDEFSNLFNGKLSSVIVSDADKGLAAAIARVAPNFRHLLCVWHIEKNKIELFIEITDIPMLTEYLGKTWLHDKEKFVAAWTNDCQHLRNTATSAVEGAHAALKRYLQVSTCDLYAKELQTLESAYVEWSSAQQAIALMQVKELNAGNMLSLSNPFLVIRKGRPLGAKNKPKSSTKRDPSAFENAKKKRHCGECGLLQNNHYRRTLEE